MRKISFILSLIIILNSATLGFGTILDKRNTLLYMDSGNSDASQATYENNYIAYLQDKYAAYYFKNLRNNFGRNVKGSCVYVAIGMLFSFYDTYWNDDIIPESYDKTVSINANTMNYVLNRTVYSPGILMESSSIINGNTDTARLYYDNVVVPYSDSHFHLKLIRMGNEFRSYYNFNDNDGPCGLGVEDRLELIDYYLHTYMSFSNSQIAYDYVDYRNGDNVREFVVNKVKQGIPVIAGGASTDGKSGHAFVIYDYDEENDELYAHMGWYGWREHVKLSTTDYINLNEAIALNVNLSHKHSNNYVYTDANGVTTTHCSCELAIHPAHVHDYTYSYTSKDENSHYAYCICGDEKSYEHSYKLNCEVNDSDTHYGYCVCGEYGTERHKYTDSYVRKDGISHYSYCACGASTTSAHILTGNEASLRQYCLLCKGLADIGAVRPYAKNAEYVTENGSYILPNGITVLADEDVEAYLNGTLRFYKNGEVSA